MSRFFVTDAPVPVYEFDPSEVLSDKAPNVVWIKARMDMATRGAVSSELVRLDKDSKELEARLGDQELALLIHNIVRWEGPDFVDEQGRPIPCTPDNIRKLDGGDPFIAEVLEEIARRNPIRKSPKKEPATPSTSMSAGVAGGTERQTSPTNGDAPSLSLQLATGRSNSTLQNAITGRLSKSAD